MHLLTSEIGYLTINLLEVNNVKEIELIIATILQPLNPILCFGGKT